jgi:hypothetical protein
VLQELKDLRSQLNEAADFCEKAFRDTENEARGWLFGGSLVMSLIRCELLLVPENKRIAASIFHMHERESVT